VWLHAHIPLWLEKVFSPEQIAQRLKLAVSGGHQHLMAGASDAALAAVVEDIGVSHAINSC
jgi:hypothetical protein